MLRTSFFVFGAGLALILANAPHAQASELARGQNGRQSWEQLNHDQGNAGLVPDFEAEIFRNVGKNPGGMPNMETRVRFNR